MINIYVYINLHHQRITLIILVTEWLWFPWIGTLLKELGRPRPQQWLRTDRFLRSPGMVVLQRIDVWSFFFLCVCVSAHLLWIIIEYYRLIMTYRCSWSLNIPQDPQRSSQLACVDKCWQVTCRFFFSWPREGDVHHQESENSDGDFKESLGRIAAPRALDLGSSLAQWHWFCLHHPHLQVEMT